MRTWQGSPAPLRPEKTDSVMVACLHGKTGAVRGHDDVHSSSDTRECRCSPEYGVARRMTCKVGLKMLRLLLRPSPVRIKGRRNQSSSQVGDSTSISKET